MTQADKPAGFLPAFREIFKFCHEWTEQIALRFDDETGLQKPREDLNHALWLLGHITWLTDALVVELPTGAAFRNKDWDALFKIGAEQRPLDAYPTYTEVLDHFKKVFAKVKDYVEALTEDDLTRPCHSPSDWIPSFHSALLHFIRDGNYHLGQISCVDKLVDRGAENDVRE